MARKGRNIYKRKDGRWEGRIKRTEADGGKYFSVYGGTYSEVREKMERVLLQKRSMQENRELTVAEALETWLRENKLYWKPSTYSCYMQQIQKSILPHFGEIKCRELKEKLSMSTLYWRSMPSFHYARRICGILIRCIRYMNRTYGYDFPVPVSPAVTMAEKYQGLFAADQLPPEKSICILEEYLFSHIEDDTCLGILLAMYTGLRIGELCALKWADIEVDSGMMNICGTMQRIREFDGQEKTKILLSVPKSVSSRRRIPIPECVWREVKKQCVGKEGFIIKGRRKEYAEPRTVQYRFKNILEKSGATPFNFHKLRHIFASRCLQQGFDFQSLSELMGHASIQTTLNIYVHSDEERKKKLMAHFTIHEVA